MKPRCIYFFGAGKADGDASMRDLLGGKGAGLAEMTNLGIPVPPGFTITTEVCVDFYRSGGRWPDGLEGGVRSGAARLEKLLGRRLGDPADPLLVSVRSGARESMPGMMDTILNLGINDRVAAGLARASGDPRFAYDSYRRFLQMFGDVVLDLKPERKGEHDPFEDLLEEMKSERGARTDTDLTADDLKDLVRRYKELIRARTGRPFPEDPAAQLELAINAVFRSWNNPRAITYRKINRIPDDWGTAVNVQAMVFGNHGADSGTGVAFTRHPDTGEPVIYGEYLLNAQGEDVVAGTRTPQPITKEQKRRDGRALPCLEEELPAIYSQLAGACRRLEAHYKDMQDIEFTIERGKLYLLQTRSGKRTGLAAVRIAVDMEAERLIDRKTAIGRVSPADKLYEIFHPVIDPKVGRLSLEGHYLSRGLPGSPGVWAGRAVFDPDTAVAWVEKARAEGRLERVVLVREVTTPDDIHGMAVSVGFLTRVGGMTSHAVLVARQLGKTCVAGCGDLRVDPAGRQFEVSVPRPTPAGGVETTRVTVREGDWITLDGFKGVVYEGQIATVPPQLDERYHKLMGWVEEARRLRVRANADTPADAKLARENGAEGIGLCRTEHMFFAEDRIDQMKDMILHLEDPQRRQAALETLRPLQKRDFVGIFKAMSPHPVTIRLLDPPLHEFLPEQGKLIAEVTELKTTSRDPQRLAELEGVLAKATHLHEANPMLGHRGCRLGITHPDIYKMQARAILEAACELAGQGVEVHPEIMIPLVGHVRELELTRRDVLEVAEEVFRERGRRVDFTVGTMIEVPRACVTAGDIAREADFFSFGTNDLTQMVFGFSRDDVNQFLPAYIDRKVLIADPFTTLDEVGVGRLMEMAVALGRETNPRLKIGICGEHGGDPGSVKFCAQAGLDYVSCSPPRVPIARLAAAQGALAAAMAAARPRTTARRAGPHRGAPRGKPRPLGSPRRGPQRTRGGGKAVPARTHPSRGVRKTRSSGGGRGAGPGGKAPRRGRR